VIAERVGNRGVRTETCFLINAGAVLIAPEFDTEPPIIPRTSPKAAKGAARLFRVSVPLGALVFAFTARLSSGATQTMSKNRNDAEVSVLAAEQARAKALVGVEIDALRNMTDVNYTHVESNGKFRTRDEFLHGLEVGEYRFSTFVIDRAAVRLEGNVAVVTGDYHNDITTPEGIQPTKYARFMRIWILREEQWVNIAHQATAYSRS
jgi:hypothetical protein